MCGTSWKPGPSQDTLEYQVEGRVNITKYSQQTAKLDSKHSYIMYVDSIGPSETQSYNPTLTGFGQSIKF